jgi:uncharacterized protein (TIGR03663 family)
MNRSGLLFAAAMLAILAVAAAMRVPRLEMRPMHADEANQAVKTGQLYETGKYDYDATDHHGPSLYWLTLPSLALGGAKDLAGSREVQYRIVPVLFGIGLIGLLLLLIDGLGKTAIAAAALLVAISPAMVFYSRYFIQETLLVFFTLATLGCGWRYVRTRRLGWMLLAGAAVGMMHATKETWILSAAAAVVAAGFTWGWRRWRKERGAGSAEHGANSLLSARTVLHVIAAVFVAVIVATALFSNFGRNLRVPWNSVLAYGNYFRRGSGGAGHSEPWHYYLRILFAYRPIKQFFWSEGFIALLAIAGSAYSLFGSAKSPARSPSLGVFLTVYTLLITALYSVISYKTPWCAVNILLGMILLAGIGVDAILRSFPARGFELSPPVWTIYASTVSLIVGAMIVATAHLAKQSYRLNFDPPLVSDSRNPYVYAHTPLGLPRLTEQLERLRQEVPGRALTVHVVAKENYWPLPWYLRKFPPNSVGYWLDATEWQKALGQLPLPDVLIISCDFDSPEIVARLGGYNGQRIESLRPGSPVHVYVREQLWPAFLGS